MKNPVAYYAIIALGIVALVIGGYLLLATASSHEQLCGNCRWCCAGGRWRRWYVCHEAHQSCQVILTVAMGGAKKH